MRPRRKRKLWAWTGGYAAGTWISGELVAGVTKNVILVDEPVLSSHGLDANTTVYRTLLWLQVLGLNGPYQTAPTFRCALWAGEEDNTDTPQNTPELDGATGADLYARKDIMMFHFGPSLYGDETSLERVGGEFARYWEWDRTIRRKVPTKGHVSFAMRMQTAANEEGTTSFVLHYRNLVVADYR